MNRQALKQLIKEKQSVLCVGLDTDITKIPTHLLKEADPVFAFNKAIIDATKDYCVSYKINTAFYEAQGIKGWESLQKTLTYIPENIFTIADAKRGDIGNTADQYAKTFFETYPFDSVTIAPYMGRDSIQPFLNYPDKWSIVLGVTSNESSKDFQLLKVGEQQLFEKVISDIASYGTPENTMFVVGATRMEQLEQVRKIIPNHFLLIPGIGTQGGNLEKVMEATLNEDYGILINVSRAVIYAGNDENFVVKAREKAKEYQKTMAALMR